MRPLALLLVLTLAACNRVQNALDPAADQAAQVKDIWTLMLWVCGVMYALVLLFLAGALWRSRKPLSERTLRGGLAAWTALIVIGIGVLAGASFLVDRRLGLADTGNALHVKVTGTQWWWKVEYQDPTASQQFITANELHLPAGRPAVIELAAEDVIHSFWIPNLAGKIDMIPARNTTLVLNPRRTGRFRSQCAEFCGLEHARMAFDAVVEDPAAFEGWWAAQLAPAAEPSNDQAQRGKELFMDRPCVGCHQITGTIANGQTGPDLTHFAGRLTLAAGTLPMARDSIVAWLADPQGIKPGNHMPAVPLSPAEREDLAAYLETLK